MDSVRSRLAAGCVLIAPAPTSFFRRLGKQRRRDRRLATEAYAKACSRHSRYLVGPLWPGFKRAHCS